MKLVSLLLARRVQIPVASSTSCTCTEPGPLLAVLVMPLGFSSDSRGVSAVLEGDAVTVSPLGAPDLESAVCPRRVVGAWGVIGPVGAAVSLGSAWARAAAAGMRVRQRVDTNR